MVKSNVHGLPVGQELVMQIFDVVVDQLEDMIAVRHQYIFKMHVFDKEKLKYLGEIEEIMLDGFSEVYIVDFVKTATNDDDVILGFTDLRYSISAVFVGIITGKTVANYHNHKTTFFNVVPLRHLAYVKEEEEKMLQIPSKLKVNIGYLMQIVKGYVSFRDEVANLKRYVFWIRVWPNKDDLLKFFDIKESYSNLGVSVKELQTFVNALTDTEVDINEFDASSIVGAVFEGMFESKIYIEKYDPLLCYKLKVVESNGFSEIGGDINGKT